MSDARIPEDIAALLAPLRDVGGYELGPALGEGGMGTVFRAQRRAPAGPTAGPTAGHTPGHTAAPVALKLLHARLAADPALVHLFLYEAKLAARLEHRNVCRVLDYGAAQGTFFLVMELHHGLTLERARARAVGLAPVSVAARIVADAARGLHAAHELELPEGGAAGVVHRDVAPGNLMVRDDGRTVVLDFGIARTDDPTRIATAPGGTRGRRGYMSPEQCRGEALDRRSDIFALGVVLWELLTGERLFPADSDLAAMLAITEQPRPAVRELRPGCSEDLDALVRAALAIESFERPATAMEFADALSAEAASEDDVGRWIRGLMPQGR